MNVEHCMIGVQLLSQLTTEMNTVADVESHRAVLKHRKVASSFRDTQLFEIFRMSCEMLRSANNNRKNLNFTDETQVNFCFIKINCTIFIILFYIFLFFLAWIYVSVFTISSELFNL